MNALNWAIRQSSWRHEKLSGHKPRKLRDWSKPLYDAELKMFKCSFLNCNVSSKRKLNLKRYMTNRKSNLKRHMTKHHEENFQALIMKKSKNDVKNRVILKYATTYSHPQPPNTIRNHSQPSATTHNHPNHPQPSTTIQDFPKRPTTTHNHPQPPTTIQKSIHKHPQNHP